MKHCLLDSRLHRYHPSQPVRKLTEIGSGEQIMKRVIRDLRFGIRSLSGSPGFALTAVLSLALGLGGTVANFTVIDAVFLNSVAAHDLPTLVACIVPALRAARIDPAQALRYDWCRTVISSKGP